MCDIVHKLDLPARAHGRPLRPGARPDGPVRPGRAAWLGLTWLAMVVAGCQSARAPVTPAARPSAPLSAPVSAPAAGLPADAVLATEARWLGEWFGGTPVQVHGEPDGSVLLAVPAKFAFDGPSATEPRPPLQAVLDKLAQSLSRQPSARLLASAPGAQVAAARTQAIERHLARRGVAPARVDAGVATPAGEPRVLLRLVPGPTAIRRLDDSRLPPPPPPSPPSPTARAEPRAAAAAASAAHDRR